MVKLDFDLSTKDERMAFIESYIAERGESSFSPKDVETMANYIFYGKEPDKENTNAVDRKEIYIETKHKSFQKRQPESLEALLESPGFNESMLDGRVRYKKVKQKIDRTEDANIPGMRELWKTIDALDHKIKVSEGKEIDENIKPYDTYGLYMAKHTLIELRTMQYVLKDSEHPTMGPINNYNQSWELDENETIYWDWDEQYAIAPLGVYRMHEGRFENLRELEERDYHYNESATHILDFRNPEHIYQLVECYEDFRIEEEINTRSMCGDIMDTLDWYIGYASLGNEKNLILDMKKKKFTVSEIQKELENQFGVKHSTNYISTIYKQKICNEIASAASLHYDSYMNRDDLSMWKKCSCCGEWKLRDGRNFMRKTRSSDGYNSKCKSCCKEDRKNSK